MLTFKSFVLGISLFGCAAAADLGRGRDLYNQGKYREAADELRQVVAADDSNSDAHRLLGLALVESDRAGEAERHINKAMELSATGQTRLAAARLAAARKEWDRAEELLRDAEGDELGYVRGLVHLNRDRDAEAARELEAFSEAHPEHAYAHYYAGLAYNQLRRPDRMLHHFEMFLKLKPDAPEARKVRSVVRSAR